MKVAGSILALPHPTSKSSSTASLPVAPFDGSSEAQHQYREASHCYASMDRKPLSRYDPNAPRSRMAMEDAPVPKKNASTISMHDPHVCHRRRFVTTSQNAYDGAQHGWKTNPITIAEETKIKKAMMEK